MADDPVVFDDGGSTRVRQLTKTGRGEMEKLFDMDPNTGGSDRTGSRHRFASQGSAYGSLKIVHIDAQGTPTTTPVRGAIDFKNFTITSEGDFEIEGVIFGGDMQVTLSGTDHAPPIVQCRQIDEDRSPARPVRRRRYIVANAGRISAVTYQDRHNNRVTVPTPPNTIYTAVFIE